ncbi:MAG TPA: ferrochelatase [Acidiferrobacterales bacterium]|nr:ferrochelatase [Acidiferrobacterales bacterium]
MQNRTAVVLFNLGGPLSLQSVEDFLFNLFSDPDIFKLPLGFITQKVFAFIFSKRRLREARAGYAAIGGRSPLLENTEKQSAALQQALSREGHYDVHICMRYWHPLTAQVVAKLKQAQYAKVVLLPLYPQYSTTTTGSSYNEFLRQCERQHYHPHIALIEHWYEQSDYQQAIVESIQHEAKKFSRPAPGDISLLFSAHGLPQKIINNGDPYERHITATYESLKEKLNWPHTMLCYQSRVGPLKWLQPYTDRVILEQAAAGAKQILVYPVAFVSDHVETLYELGIVYAKLAQQAGISEYRVTPALNDHPLLIRTLKKLTLNALAQS